MYLPSLSPSLYRSRRVWFKVKLPTQRPFCHIKRTQSTLLYSVDLGRRDRFMLFSIIIARSEIQAASIRFWNQIAVYFFLIFYFYFFWTIIFTLSFYTLTDLNYTCAFDVKKNDSGLKCKCGTVFITKCSNSWDDLKKNESFNRSNDASLDWAQN